MLKDDNGNINICLNECPENCEFFKIFYLLK